MKKIIKYKGKNFYNFPIKLTTKDYYDALKIFKNRIKNKKNISAYLYGSFNNIYPGFSDIDLIISTKKTVDENIKNILDLESYDKKTKFILYHEPLFLPINLVTSHGKIMGGEKYKLKLIQGKKVKLTKPTNENIEMRRWDDLVYNEAKELYSFYLSKNIDVRSLAHKLNCLKYRFTKWIKKEENQELYEQIDKYTQRILKQRKNWFRYQIEQNLDELLSLLNEALIIQEKGIKLLEKYIEKKYVDKKNIKNKKYYVKDITNPIIFKNSDNYFNETLEIYKKYKILIPVFPPAFFALTYEYSKYDGLISNHIKKIIGKNSEQLLKIKYVTDAKNRISYYNEQAEYCIRNQIEYGPLVNFDKHIKLNKYRTKIKRFFLNKIKETRLKIIYQKKLI